MDSLTWLLTGAGSGFGFALTQEVLRRSHRVVAADLRIDSMAEPAGRHPGRLLPVRVDVTDPAQVRAGFESGVLAFGPTSYVVSCAGFGALGAIEEQTDALITRQIAVNLTGSINVARAASLHPRNAGGGRLFQFSSCGGQVADPGMSVCNATKFGIEGFFESIAGELAPFGIEVAPGGSGTAFTANMAHAEAMDEYQDGILGQIRGMLTAGPDATAHMFRVDPDRVAAAIADSIAVHPAPRRIVLGSSAYEAAERELRTRLDALAGQHDLDYAADAAPGDPR